MKTECSWIQFPELSLGHIQGIVVPGGLDVVAIGIKGEYGMAVRPIGLIAKAVTGGITVRLPFEGPARWRHQ